ncbi:MAG: hypothetical protein R2776_06605 [Flavobacteriaceae bacterium]|nr:hypothetical protein [Flavobacteriaceae bacterium]
MAPIKFEDNIREKLQERELMPSQEAWTKLSEKLDAQMPQKKSNTFIWVAVAASFVGVLLVSTLFFKKEEATTQIVKENPVENSENASEIKTQSDLATEEIINETIEKPIEMPKVNKEVAKISDNKKEERVASEKPSGKMIINKSSEESVASLEMKTETLEEKFITEKVEEVVVAVQQIQQENNTVTPGEIDALLAKAQRDIANNRILNSNIQKVDAAALLMDVETELEQSFRDRVFNMLGEGFNKVRSAVAERNN